MRAIWALIPSAIIAVSIAVVPTFHAVAGFSWFIGAGLGLVFYLIVADRKMPINEVDGESIAVPSVH